MKGSGACLLVGAVSLALLLPMPLSPVPGAILFLQINICCIGSLICRAIEKGRE